MGKGNEEKKEEKEGDGKRDADVEEVPPLNCSILMLILMHDILSEGGGGGEEGRGGGGGGGAEGGGR